MAKKKPLGVNKSAVIREYMAAHPGAGSKEVVAALAKAGTHVSEGLVNNIKYRKSEKKAAKKNRLVLGVNNVSVSDVLEMKILAQKLGGTANAQAALDALRQLSE